MEARRLAAVAAIVLTAALTLWAPAASGQGLWGLEDRAYYEPLIAEIRAANVNVLFWGQSDEFSFMQEPGRRRIWDIGLGKEIGLVGYETGEGRDGPFLPGEWGVGVWMPVSFHMVEDFKDESNPIINTDYRFSGMVKTQAALREGLQLGGRFQFGHESTHLGDEFTLGAQKDPTFQRVNVSYEYWEWGASAEWRLGSAPEHHLIARLGGIGLFDDEKGFYSETLLFPEGGTLLPSVRNYETTVGVEWTLNNLTDNDRALLGGYWPFVSVDARHRTVYDYAKPTADIREDSQWSFNLFVGLRPGERDYIQKGLPNFYFRFYHGVNPHGQFRNQPSYSMFGFGLHVPV